MHTRLPHQPPTGLALPLLLTGFAILGCGHQPMAPASSAHTAHESPARATSHARSIDAPGPSAAPEQPAENLDPVLQIVLPHPSPLLSALVPPTFTARWEASDPDARSSRPLESRYLLLDEHSAFPIEVARANPDSLRRRYGPRFEEWTPVRGGHTELELRDLTPNSMYLLALVAQDPEGGFNRVFSLRTNLLFFRVGFPGSLGPLITVTGDIQYQRPQGGLLDDPALAPHFTIPMDRVTTIRWSAGQTLVDELDGTRWALDPLKIDGSSHGAGRDGGWSGWSASAGAASVGPFTAPGEHRFYIEARTKIGWLTRLLLILDVSPTAIIQGRGQRS